MRRTLLLACAVGEALVLVAMVALFGLPSQALRVKAADPNAEPKAVAVRYLQDEDKGDGSEWALRTPGFQRFIPQTDYANILKSAQQSVHQPAPIVKNQVLIPVAVADIGGLKHVLVQGGSSLQSDVIERRCAGRWVVLESRIAPGGGKPAHFTASEANWHGYGC